MADEDNPTLDQIKKFKVAELKAHLSNLGLQTTGLKVDLVARLASHYETQVHDATGREEDGQGQTQAATNDDTEGKQLENIALDSTPLLAPTENIESRGTESKVIDNDSFQKGIATTFQISDKRGSDSAIPEREHVGGAEERVNRQAVPEPGEVTQEERIPQKPWQEDSELVTMHKTEKLEEPKQAVEPVNEPSLIDTVTMDESSTMSEPVLPKESVQPVPQVEPVPQAKPVPQVEPVSQIERVPQVQPIPLAKPVSESETRHQVEPIPQVKLVPQVEPVQPAEPLSTVEPVASAKHDRMEPSAGMSRKDIEPVVEVRPYQPTVPKSTTVAAPQSQKTEMSPENDQTKSSQDQTPKASQEKPQVKPDHERNVAKPTEMDTSRVAPSKLTPSFPIKTPPAESRGGHVEVGLHRTYVPQTGESRKPTSLSAGSEMMKKVSQPGRRGDDSGYEVDQGEQEDMTSAERPQQEAGKKKKKKKKRRKKKGNDQTTTTGGCSRHLSKQYTIPSGMFPNCISQVQEDTSRDEGIEVEYVPETLDVRDPVYAQFAQIFETFKLTEKPEAATKDDAKDKQSEEAVEAPKKDPNDAEMDTDSDEEEEEKQEADTGENVEKLSKKKLKLKNRMSVAELKQCVTRPDVVEMHDVTAQDPKLLVYLKACRNTVPVPRHWCFKRKFLQGKRGIIKPPFQLPEFIQKTGIMEMREALQEKEDAKNMKAKMREKVRPKMGKIDIDYQKLHDAFFKWQTKPKMTIHGDLYYEGKEFETKLKEKKPGDLSEELRTALGMPTGQGSNLVPPPWLIAMQRYGPPPSYPSLKIPGLNAPIPEGASFGYHAGGWGKPPVDEQGRPLYGDVFGVQQTDANLIDDDQVDSTLWGELESESEESEESEEESEEEAPDQTGLVTPAETGLVTPSGLTSIPAGMETPDMIELRKRKNIEEAMESGSDQPTLYTVLPEKRVGVGAMMMGSSHVYDLATAAPTGTKKTPGGLSEGVEVALDPSELELDPAAMQARYDEQLREQQNTQKEDFSDMVAEHAARQQKKRKKTADSGKAAKKYKEFKF